ncbi:MAG: methionyl-tRNA formyltransferase [Elusimicrobia bacterium]|nr:MAG: methionyl-tRNA formyltransferase [Elusimicrobiota bacterium]KAF0154075.1 MAG: methionyl-tRNA formyltransferase [Elusimicrobiota bacterium]
MSGPRLVFLGTPGTACPFLESLVSAGFEVAGVIAQPDRPVGRGMKMCCPPVKNSALALNLPVFQPASGAELREAVAALKPDLGVVVAYGRLIKKEVLSLPPLGFINLHFSLLPRYRGAAPVQWSLINGETETGVTVFRLDEGMDTGPVVASVRTPVDPAEDAPALFARLTELGRALLVSSVREIGAGRASFTPQSGEPSHAPKIRPALSFLSPSMTPAAAFDLFRGLACGPRARFATPAGMTVQVLKASLRPPTVDTIPHGVHGAGVPGTVGHVEPGRGFFVRFTGGSLFLEELKPEGRGPVGAADFLNGARLVPGDALIVPPTAGGEGPHK